MSSHPIQKATNQFSIILWKITKKSASRKHYDKFNNPKKWKITNIVFLHRIDLISAIEAVADRFINVSEIDKLKQFIGFNRNDLENHLKRLNEIVSLAEENLRWDEKRLREIRNYVNNKKSNANIVMAMNLKTILPVIILIQYLLYWLFSYHLIELLRNS